MNSAAVVFLSRFAPAAMLLLPSFMAIVTAAPLLQVKESEVPVYDVVVVSSGLIANAGVATFEKLHWLLTWALMVMVAV